MRNSSARLKKTTYMAVIATGLWVLANPAFPKMGLRGVYAKEMILPVIKAMKAIGYRRALVLYGSIDDSDKGMDEASVCGTTYCAELSENG